MLHRLKLCLKFLCPMQRNVIFCFRTFASAGMLLCFLSSLWISVVNAEITKEVKVGGEFCLLDRFQATCAGRSLIFLLEAKFGRMRTGACITETHSLGCYSDVITFLDQKCSGRQFCTVPVIELMPISQGCPREVFSYLDVTYTCVSYIEENEFTCSTVNKTLITGEHGYFSSTILSFFRPQLCPFSVNAQSGQRLRFTLYDFTMAASYHGAVQSSTEQSCPVVVIFTEREDLITVNLCDGSDRESQIYTSSGHVVDLEFNLNPRFTTIPLLLIKYEAVGCPDFQVPEGTEFYVSERNESVSTVMCNITNQLEVWYLACEDPLWIGQLGNCTRETEELVAVTVGVTASTNQTVAKKKSSGTGLHARKTKFRRLVYTTVAYLVYLQILHYVGLQHLEG